MKDKAFYNKDEQLSAYGLICGYVQKGKVKGTDVNVELYYEHQAYHVKRSDWHKVREETGSAESVWFTTYSLTEARKVFNLFKQGKTL